MQREDLNMEDKILKTNIYLNDVLFNDSCEQAIDIDFTLPDYCPDISKIFKCQAVPRVSSKGLNGKNINIDGTVLLTIIYSDRDGNLCSYEYQYPFSKNLEITEEFSGVNLACYTKTEYINCRAITGRKVDIHGAVGIIIKIFKRKSEEIISDIDDSNIELYRGVAPATVPMGYAEKYLLVEEELILSESQPNVRNILRTDAKSCIRETKIVNDKAVVKGEMTVCILYCAEGISCPQNFKTTIPFSQIIDVDGLNDSCSCETKSEIAFFEVKPRVSSTGEIKTFALTAKLLLTTSAWCSNEIAVVLDAFSRKYQADIKKNKMCFEKILFNISETYHCKKGIELENSIDSIIDLWCNINSVSVRFENENIIILGVISASIIASDQKENLCYFEKTIDFEYKYPLPQYSGILSCKPEIEIISCSYTLLSPENIEIRADISVNAAIYEKNEMSLISDFCVDKNKLNCSNKKGAMIIYFTSEGDRVWDIARIYNSAVQDIMKINNLESETLPEGKMLLIPMT